MNEEVSQRERKREQQKREAEERQREEMRRFTELMRRQEANPLDVLNLPGDATPAQIKARYRALCKQLHPDSNAGNDAASGLLRQVTKAMEQLRAQGKA